MTNKVVSEDVVVKFRLGISANATIAYVRATLGRQISKIRSDFVIPERRLSGRQANSDYLIRVTLSQVCTRAKEEKIVEPIHRSNAFLDDPVKT